MFYLKMWVYIEYIHNYIKCDTMHIELQIALTHEAHLKKKTFIH